MKPSEGSRALIKSIRGTKAGSRANYEETFALSIVTCEDRCEEAGEVLPGRFRPGSWQLVITLELTGDSLPRSRPALHRGRKLGFASVPWTRLFAQTSRPEGRA